MDTYVYRCSGSNQKTKPGHSAYIILCPKCGRSWWTYHDKIYNVAFAPAHVPNKKAPDHSKRSKNTRIKELQDLLNEEP